MTPDNPKPTNPNDTDKSFVPAAPELEVPKTYEYKVLTSEEQARIIADLVEMKKGPVEKKYAVYLVDGHEEAARLGRGLESEVFGEFFNNNESLLQQEYSPYEEHSKFLIVVDHENNRAAGVMRLISNSDEGLKSLNDLTKQPWVKPLDELFSENDIKQSDLNHTWDIATLAVSGEYRGKTSVASALYHSLYKSSLENNIVEWVAVLDNNVLELLEALGLFFNRYQGLGAESYLDSPLSTPVYANVASIISRMSIENSDAYKYLALGEGVDRNIDFTEIY